MAITFPQTTPESAEQAQAAQNEQVEAQTAVADAQTEAPKQVAAAQSEAVAQKQAAPTPVAEAQKAPAPVVRKPAAPVAAGGQLADTMNELADAGFADLEVNGMSFNRIKLNNGTFLYGSDQKNLGTEFKGVVMSTRAIYVIKAEDADDAPMFYSYSAKGATLSDGSPSDDTIAEWLEKGYAPNAKTGLWHTQKYSEAMVTITESKDGIADGEVVICQIPPASLARFGGYAMLLKVREKCLPSEVETLFKVGPVVTKDRTSFTPWEFAKA